LTGAAWCWFPSRSSYPTWIVALVAILLRFTTQWPLVTTVSLFRIQPLPQVSTNVPDRSCDRNLMKTIPVTFLQRQNMFYRKVHVKISYLERGVRLRFFPLC
jgi:hypothetical protein